MQFTTLLASVTLAISGTSALVLGPIGLGPGGLGVTVPGIITALVGPGASTATAAPNALLIASASIGGGGASVILGVPVVGVSATVALGVPTSIPAVSATSSLLAIASSATSVAASLATSAAASATSAAGSVTSAVGATATSAPGYVPTFANAIGATFTNDYLKYTLVTNLSVYDDVNGKNASPQYTCSLYSECHTSASATNLGQQTQPDGTTNYIANSAGYCQIGNNVVA